ncbi:hypothetical protein N6H13_08825 [Paenibacillus sp. CC-CFT742]|nr:hypothetical protein [Paenibacillus sp. CC-CFT742]WJH30710.1 hypothetical protein N6H13_08825 [Paenibacillus sp. CC-CFT742]
MRILRKWIAEEGAAQGRLLFYYAGECYDRQRYAAAARGTQSCWSSPAAIARIGSLHVRGWRNVMSGWVSRDASWGLCCSRSSTICRMRISVVQSRPVFMNDRSWSQPSTGICRL